MVDRTLVRYIGGRECPGYGAIGTYEACLHEEDGDVCWFHGFRDIQNGRLHIVNAGDLEEVRGGMTVDAVLALPPVQWSNVIRAMDDQALIALDDKLSSEIVHRARLSAYINAVRRNYNHQRAVSYTNRFTTKIRKLLGYSYPDKGSFSF